MIGQIQDTIADLYREYKIPALTLNLSIDELQKWTDIISKRLKLDLDEFHPRASEFFWAVSHVQLALGYALLARKSCSHPKGRAGISYDEIGVPQLLDLCDMHFWHHAFCVRECIYRCWERLAALLLASCFPRCPQKLYFDGIVNQIGKDQNLSRIPELKLLRRQVKHWNKAAAARNRLSHHESSPLTKTRIEVELTNLIGLNGKHVPKYYYSSEGSIQEIAKLKEAYLRLLPAFNDVRAFIGKYSENRTSG